MKRDHDAFSHVVETWLDLDEAHEDPALVLDRVVSRLDATPQRGSSWLARGFPRPGNAVRTALAAAAVVDRKSTRLNSSHRL